MQLDRPAAFAVSLDVAAAGRSRVRQSAVSAAPRDAEVMEDTAKATVDTDSEQLQVVPGAFGETGDCFLAGGHLLDLGPAEGGLIFPQERLTRDGMSMKA